MPRLGDGYETEYHAKMVDEGPENDIYAYAEAVYLVMSIRYQYDKNRRVRKTHREGKCLISDMCRNSHHKV